MKNVQEGETCKQQCITALGLQLPPFQRWLGWVPGGSNHLLRRWARSPSAVEANLPGWSLDVWVNVGWFQESMYLDPPSFVP